MAPQVPVTLQVKLRPWISCPEASVARAVNCCLPWIARVAAAGATTTLSTAPSTIFTSAMPTLPSTVAETAFG